MSTRKCVTHAVFAAVLACAGCAEPQFDVHYDPTSGQPTVSSIVQRIACELTDMVRNPLPGAPGFSSSKPSTGAALFLLNGDYDVVVSLSLEVNDTGGLTPNITFMEPVNKLISFAFGGSATLSESRDHTFTDNFQMSLRKLYADAQMARDPSLAPEPELLTGDEHKKARAAFAHDCPTGDTNLASVLGIKNIVAMGADTDRLMGETDTPATKAAQVAAVAPPAAAPPAGQQKSDSSNSAAPQGFGGTITFVVTKNVSGVGPTWTTTRWKGPGGLVGLSHVNTDKVTLAFAQGPHVGEALQANKTASEQLAATPPKDVTPNGPNVKAYNFLQQQNVQSLSNQVQMLVNQSQ